MTKKEAQKYTRTVIRNLKGYGPKTTEDIDMDMLYLEILFETMEVNKEKISKLVLNP